eukprot:sb/3479449/
MCRNGIDQLGCGSLECERKGKRVTVSDNVLCDVAVGSLCDDGITTWCIPLTTTESIHRHLICTNKHADKQDCKQCPDAVACAELETSVSCLRRVRWDYGDNTTTLPILRSWVMDGRVDCMGGEDEDPSRWKECRYGNTTVHVTLETECGVRFKCPSNPSVFYDPSELCNGRNKEDCPELESVLCSTTKLKHSLETASENNTDFERYLSRECIGNHSNCDTKTLPPEIYGAKPITIYVLPGAQYNCSTLYGLDYVYAACLGHCGEDNITCPLSTQSIHYRTTCPSLPNRYLGLTTSNTLEFVELVDNGTTPKHREIFVCRNGNWTSHVHVCDLIDDCGDRWDQVCDQHRDCSNYRDECHEGCPSRTDKIVSSTPLAVLGWLIGVPAVVINAVVIFRNIRHLVGCTKHTKINFTITVFITLVGLGDFLVAVYLVALNVDSIAWRDQFCAHRFDWQSSSNCQVLGVISTLGTQLSILSMTVISVYRAIIMRQFNSKKMNRAFFTKIIIGVLVVVIVSTLVAMVPTVGPLIDAYFLNGFYLPSSNFISCPRREADLVGVVREYFNETTGDVGNVKDKIREMFVAPSSQPHLSIELKSLNFYGSSSSCLFKYFVTPEDPQRTYSWVVIVMDCICFVVIATSYISVHTISQESAGRVNARKRWGALQQKITLILLSDLFCWVPFLVACILHYVKVFNLISYYSLFSTVFLPLNSLINPVIYDSFFATLPKKCGSRVRESIRSGNHGDQNSSSVIQSPGVGRKKGGGLQQTITMMTASGKLGTPKDRSRLTMADTSM